MFVDVILGLQWGDEGKGKIVDFLSPAYSVVARFQGGPNAGHTIISGSTKIILHTIPSGITSESTVNIIGNGVLIDPCIFSKEIDKLVALGYNPKKNLVISNKAHFILPSHRLLDAAQEALLSENKIGSTLKGIGPAYTDKYARKGLRVGTVLNTDCILKFKELENQHYRYLASLGYASSDFKIDLLTYEQYRENWLNSIELLREFSIVDTEMLIHQYISEKKKILAEGAQGTMLDVEFGSYPYVTSSNTTIGGVCCGLGIPPSAIGKVFGVFKAYCTRVGNGPFPTELFDENGQTLRSAGFEFGSTTGRPRRCGWLDLPALKYSIMINGVSELILTKADVLNSLSHFFACTSYGQNDKGTFTLNPLSVQEENVKTQLSLSQFNSWKEDISGCRSFSELPENVTKYIQFIENEVKIPVSIISTGPERTQTIFKNS